MFESLSGYGQQSSLPHIHQVRLDLVGMDLLSLFFMIKMSDRFSTALLLSLVAE